MRTTPKSVGDTFSKVRSLQVVEQVNVSVEAGMTLSQLHRNSIVMCATPEKGGLGLGCADIKRKLYRIFKVETSFHLFWTLFKN